MTGSREVSGGRMDPDYFSKYYTDLKTTLELGSYPLGKLSDYCIGIYSGQTPASSEYSDEISKYPIIKVSSYSNDNIDLNKLAYTKSKQNYSIQKGDIFILSAAHQAEYVGKHIKYLDETPKTKTSFVGELLCIRTDEKQLLSNYLFTLLNISIYKTLINREKTGQTSHIYAKDIKKIDIPIPPYFKQLEISNHISNIRKQAYSLIEEAKNVLETAKNEVEQMILG